MPIAPSTRMRSFAARWLTDEVQIADVSYPADTRPLGKASTTVDDAVYVAALVRQDAVTVVDGVTVRRDLREVTVWVADVGYGALTTDADLLLMTDVDVALTVDAATGFVPVAGQRCTIVHCGDVSLVGRFGEVVSVERDALRAVRRLTVRLANDD